MEQLVKRILVAEDNSVLADVLRFNLEHAGFHVSVAGNGLEAVEHLKREVIDLLITDYQMPGLSGEELCRHVRESLQWLDLPIIICSAKGLELDTEQLITRWNVSKIVFKPFSLREVVGLAQRFTSSAIAANV